MSYEMLLMLTLDDDGAWAGLNIDLPFVPVAGMELQDYLGAYTLVVKNVLWQGQEKSFLVDVGTIARKPIARELLDPLFERYGWEVDGEA